MTSTKSKALLSQDSILILQPILARAIGLNEAIVTQQVHYYVEGIEESHKRAGERSNLAEQFFFEGRWWTYGSYKHWQDKFPWWSVKTVQRIFDSAVEQGALLSQPQYAENGAQLGNWYTPDYDRINDLVDAVRPDSLPPGQNDQPPPHVPTEDPLDNLTTGGGQNDQQRRSIEKKSIQEESTAIAAQGASPRRSATPIPPRRPAIPTGAKAEGTGKTPEPAGLEKFILEFVRKLNPRAKGFSDQERRKIESTYVYYDGWKRTTGDTPARLFEDDPMYKEWLETSLETSILNIPAFSNEPYKFSVSKYLNMMTGNNYGKFYNWKSIQKPKPTTQEQQQPPKPYHDPLTDGVDLPADFFGGE